MVLCTAIRSFAALVAAGLGLVLGAATSLASEPLPESSGRSGIWPPVTSPLAATGVGPDGLADWVFGAVILLVATATLAFQGDGASAE